MLTGKRILRFGAAAAAALTLLFSVQGVLPASASSLSDLQQKQSQLKQQQAQVAQQIQSLKNDKAKQQQYKDALNAQIGVVQGQIDNLNAQISGYDNDIKAKETEIAGKQQDINTNYQKLKERLCALYLTGEASNIEIILNSQSVMDLADKTELLQSITAYDTNLINTIKSEMAGIKSQESDIQKNKAAVTAAKTEYDQKQSELSALVSQTNAVIAKISSDQSGAEAKNKEILDAEAKADQAIDDWYRNYYASQQQHNGGGSNNGGGSGGYVSKGNFTWPVPSCTNITQGYGSYDMGSFHKGIDISGAGVYGAPIVAADSGRVIKAGYGVWGDGYGGYGNVVVIDHGGGFSTLCAHMSSVAVSAGQQVSKGQVIGYVGSTGQSTGAHCHFEIRVNGSAVNPMNYFG